MRNKILKAGLQSLYRLQAHQLMAPLSQGVGLIFTLHHVSPKYGSFSQNAQNKNMPNSNGAFDPNGILRVTPDFLAQVLDLVQNSDMDIISLDEAHARLLAHDFTRRFVCFTFDDGYRDNKIHAAPLFKERNLPFTVYVPSDFAEGRGELWWIALERIIAANDEISFDMGRGEETASCAQDFEKSALYDRIYWWLRSISESDQRAFIRKLAFRAHFSLEQLCSELIMNWDELREFAKSPLVTIGAHTVGHYAIGKLDEEHARFEMAEGAAQLEQQLGRRPAHFSFPYGDKGSAGPRDFALAQELGFKTAVTTRKGVLHPDHCDYLTALPRVSLNGDFQSLEFVELYLSGMPFMLWNGFRRMNVA